MLTSAWKREDDQEQPERPVQEVAGSTPLKRLKSNAPKVTFMNVAQP